MEYGLDMFFPNARLPACSQYYVLCEVTVDTRDAFVRPANVLGACFTRISRVVHIRCG